MGRQSAAPRDRSGWSGSSNFALLFHTENSRDFFLFFTCGMIITCTAQLVPSWPQSVPFSLLRGHVGRYIRFAFFKLERQGLHSPLTAVGRPTLPALYESLFVGSVSLGLSIVFFIRAFLLVSLLSSFFVLRSLFSFFTCSFLNGRLGAPPDFYLYLVRTRFVF